MPSDHDDTRPPGGFLSYADDTPREADDPPAPLPAVWSDTPAWRQVEEPLPNPGWRTPLMASCGVIGLLALGVGWAVTRDPVAPAATSAAPLVADAPTTPSEPLQVVVVAPPPPPTPAPGERLEVLPRSPPNPAARVAAAPTPPAVVARLPPAPETPSVAVASREASARVTPPVAEPARFDACSDAPTRAYQMVCSDRGLAEADRRMKRAYSAALAAGVPRDDLWRDQEDWLEVREDAARVSRRAVADIYRQRTRELFAMADGPRD